MKLLMLSVRLYIYGLCCDACIKICTALAERKIGEGKPLGTRMVSGIGRVCEKSLARWTVLEKRFIKLSLEKEYLIK